MLSVDLLRAARRLALPLALLAAGCSADVEGPTAVVDAESYRLKLAEWQQTRIERLKSKNGYLNLVGLYWLAEGEQHIGAGTGADIVLPAGKAPAWVGTLLLEGDRVSFTPAPDVEVQVNGRTVAGRRVLADDSGDGADLVSHDTLGWFIIRRGNRFGVRVRDYMSAALASFPGIDRFAAELRWRVAAKLERYSPPRPLAVDTVVDGLVFEPVSPGVLKFEIDNRPLELEVYGADGDAELFILFAASTSGDTTYSAGRFLTAPWPDDQGWTVLDFNRAYNPPCAFNDFATCPIAPLRNRLPVAIEAGEKYSHRLHVAGR